MGTLCRAVRKAESPAIAAQPAIRIMCSCFFLEVLMPLSFARDAPPALRVGKFYDNPDPLVGITLAWPL